MRSWVPIVVVVSLMLSACGGRLVKKQYEYEEELYLALDGSATLNVNASVPALVALRGADLNPSSRARFERDRRRYAAHSIHVRARHGRQELARVGRQRFEETALAFGEHDVERE
jgi:hypothetical protein